MHEHKKLTLLCVWVGEFVNPLTTLTGQTIDLEDYALDNVYFWHALWYSIVWPVNVVNGLTNSPIEPVIVTHLPGPMILWYNKHTYTR